MFKFRCLILLLITCSITCLKLFMNNNKKFILVTGGVISGIGKGVTASSVGVVSKMLNVTPTAIKIDPYLNVDAGTMSPFEHGECFVLDDGGETDLDLGNYERFLDVSLTNDSNLTTGKVYNKVIAKERRGEYLGKTVQIIPHITNEIIEQIMTVSQKPVDENDVSHSNEPDLCVIELGGTIGDIESMPFVEALRQLQVRVKPENFCIVHVSMVPTIGENDEQKTKPTQHSVKELRSLGLSPDFLVCRSKNVLDSSTKEKLALFCNVPTEHVLSSPDLANIYHVPKLMMGQNLHNLLAKRLGLPIFNENNPYKLKWENMVNRIDNANDEATIALVGKYTNQLDSYLSIISALKHGCIYTDQKLKLLMVESSHLEENMITTNPTLYNEAWAAVRSANGILVPGGFGIRGIEGKIKVTKYARENKIPFLGICLGMQVAVIEYTRSILNRPLANSREFVPDIDDNNAAVIFMPEGSKEQMGGTMRLGSRTTILKPNSIIKELYNDIDKIDERHRHRYEVNPNLTKLLEEKGLKFSGTDITNERMEVVEIDKKLHPYFIAVQFHPEFKSRPLHPSPVFYGLLQAVKNYKKHNT